MEKIRKWLSRPDNKVLIAIIILGAIMLLCILVEMALNGIKDEKTAESESLRFGHNAESSDDVSKVKENSNNDNNGDDVQVWVSGDGQVFTFSGLNYKWENGEDYIQGEYELYTNDDAKAVLDSIVENIEGNEKVTENMLENIHSEQRTWKEDFNNKGTFLLLLNLKEGKINGEDAVLMETVYRGKFIFDESFYTKSGEITIGDCMSLDPLISTETIFFDEEKNAGLRRSNSEDSQGNVESVDLGFDYILPDGFDVIRNYSDTGGDGAELKGMTAKSKNKNDELDITVASSIGRYKREEWVTIDSYMSKWLPIEEIDGVYFCMRQVGPVIESAYFFERGILFYAFTSTNQKVLDEFFKSVKFKNPSTVKCPLFLLV